MPSRLLGITTWLLVQSCQPPVCRHQAGKHGQRGLECQGSALEMTEPGQRYSQIKVARGKEMLQSDGDQRLLGGLFISPLSQLGDG
jgi:hypothetical protein